VKILVAVVAATIAASLNTNSAQARSLQVHHKPWAKMTQHQKVEVLRKQIYRDHCIIRFWHNHQNIVSEQRHIQVHWAQTSLRIATHNLHKYQFVGGVSGFPPHHALWMCLHSVEGPWNDTSSPHFGGLQMTAGWGGLANAGMVSQSVQEWTAEREYKNSGYSPSFIYNQWLRWEYGKGNKCIPLE